MSRPELQGPPELYYNEVEAAKYNSNSRIMKIQEELTLRALELLNLPAEKQCLLLDIGCGSGLSGEALAEAGHAWIGVDISKHMLEIAREREGEGDVCLRDMGQGMPFRSGVFDGAVSISAVQWLCYSSSKQQTVRAVLQVYPETAEQLELLSSTAMKNGFSGGVVIDFPNSAKAKKYYLCLFAGQSAPSQVPQGLGGGDQEAAAYESRRQKSQQRGRKSKRVAVKSRDWITAKKEQQRKRGKEIKNDSKYTGRRRASGF